MGITLKARELWCFEKRGYQLMSFREARSSQIYLFVEVLMIFEGSVVLFEDLIN